MNLQTLIGELAAAGYTDSAIARAMREIGGMPTAPSIVQRLRVGTHTGTNWARTNALILVHKELMQRKQPAKAQRKAPLVPAVRVKGTGWELLRHIDPQVASDFLVQRKDKRRPLTDTALRSIELQAERAGLTLEQALRVCCEYGWVGFRASWYERVQQEGSRQRFSGASFVLRDVKM